MRIPISIIMAGGKGTRFNSSYKPFTKICGKPMIINILEVASYISDFIAIAISENTEKYVDILKNTNALIIYTPGINYSVDLSILLNIIKKRPILILPSDFPFLNKEVLIEILSKSLNFREPLITILNKHGEYTGISIFKGYNYDKWKSIKVNYEKELFNLNTLYDLQKIKEICHD